MPMPAQSPQDEDLPADDIIEILQQNPDLLAEAKAEIVAQLRDRGYPVTDRSITDDRLFSEIRSDERARHLMSNALKQRGFGLDQAQAQAQAGGPAAAPPTPPAPATAGAGQAPAGIQPGNAAAAQPALVNRPREGRRQGQGRGLGIVQDLYPLRDLP